MSKLNKINTGEQMKQELFLESLKEQISGRGVGGFKRTDIGGSYKMPWDTESGEMEYQGHGEKDDSSVGQADMGAEEDIFLKDLHQQLLQARDRVKELENLINNYAPEALKKLDTPLGRHMRIAS
jgi:hypothetical protein